MKTALATATLAALLAGAPLHAAPRHPMAEKAEASFFAFLNDGAGSKEAVLRDLTTAYAIDPTDPRTTVLLGLDELWLAREGNGADPMAIPHLILAEHYLTRAQALNPADDRIPSWVVPARLGLAGVERRREGAKEAYDELRAAYERHPGFHSFSLALMNARQKPDSREFQEGLAALRAVFAGGCREKGDPSCNNRPRWPHNVEGFVLFAAEYEAKGGDLARAAELITELKSRPDFPTWPYQSDAREVEELIAAARNPAASGVASHAAVFAPGKRSTCQSCHRGK